jgi:probable F420-dependent oxidoreductase
MALRPPTFGVRLPLVQGPVGLGWEEEASAESLARVARRADELGYGFVATGEHVVIPQEESHWLGRWADPFVTLGHVAAMTKDVRLIVALTVLPYKHPLWTAKVASTLDWLSAGRLTLGVGAGYLQREYDALGLSIDQRGSLMEDYLKALDVLLTEPVASYRGKHVDFEGLVVAPRPVQAPRPPIWIGGTTDPAIRRAARHGDGWVLASVEVDYLRRGLELARTVPGFEARAAEFDVAVSVLPLGGVAGVRGGPMEPSAPPTSTSAEQAAEEIGQLLAVGATHFRVHFITDTEAQFLEDVQWFSEHVVPLFR